MFGLSSSLPLSYIYVSLTIAVALDQLLRKCFFLILTHNKWQVHVFSPSLIPGSQCRRAGRHSSHRGSGLLCVVRCSLQSWWSGKYPPSSPLSCRLGMLATPSGHSSLVLRVGDFTSSSTLICSVCTEAVLSVCVAINCYHCLVWFLTMVRLNTLFEYYFSLHVFFKAKNYYGENYYVLLLLLKLQFIR